MSQALRNDHLTASLRLQPAHAHPGMPPLVDDGGPAVSFFAFWPLWAF